MSNKAYLTLAFAAVCLTVVFGSGRANSQVNSMPLGQVNLPVEPVNCPPGFANEARCYTGSVSCPNTVDIGFTYGLVNSGGTDGTVVFFNGQDGTTPGFSQFIPAYTPPAHNFQTVQVIWATPWEDTGNGTGNSLKAAACRPATILDWMLGQRNVFAGGGRCAQGASAGSAAVAYSITHYGAYQYLNHVSFQSGPVLSDLSTGCNPESKPITVCPGNQCLTGGEGSWQDSPIYVDGAEKAVSGWTGASGNNACSSRNIPQSQYTGWGEMSIVDGLSGKLTDATFNYPETSITGWLCSKPANCNSSYCQNNSAAQGQFYYQNVTSPKSVYRVDGCQSTEGVDEGTVPALNNQSGLQAIITDMVTQCVAP